MKTLVHKSNSHATVKLRPSKNGTIIIFTIHATNLLIVVKFPTNIAGRIEKCKEVVDKMSRSPWFTPDEMNPIMERLIVLLVKIDKADRLAKTRMIGKAAARNILLNQAMVLVFELSKIVYRVCNRNKNHEKEIAQSAGMDLKSPGGCKTFVFSVKATGIDGQILVTCPVDNVLRPDHEIQISIDKQEPRKWNEILVPVSKKAKIYVNDLPIDVEIFIRHRFIFRHDPNSGATLSALGLLTEEEIPSR